MKKSNYLIGLALGASTLTFAQVGIGTSTPSSPLDIQADDAAIDLNSEAAAGSRDPKINFQLTGTTTFSIGLDDADDDKLKIGVGAPETSTRMTIDGSGNVGIGNTSPTATLDVDGSAIFNESGAAVDFRVEGDTEANLLFVDGSADRVGVGTSSPTEKLHVVGNIYGSEDIVAGDFLWAEHVGVVPGNGEVLNSAPRYGMGWSDITTLSGGVANSVQVMGWYGVRLRSSSTILDLYNISSQARLQGSFFPSTDNAYDLGAASLRWNDVYATNGTIQTSDRRLKTNIDTLNYGLAEVMQLTPVSFNWKSDSSQTRNKIGYIAQEVQKVIPEVVDVGDDENQTLGMNYGEMVVVLTNAIKEQQAIIESQKKENESQKAEIESLKAEASNATSSSEENASEIEALKAQVQQLLQLLQQQESVSVVK